MAAPVSLPTMSTSALSNDPKRLLELGASLEAASLWDDAGKVYEILLDIEPTNMTAIARCLAVSLRRADPDAAARTLLRISSAHAGTAPIHAMVARALLQVGRKDAAVD
jgi:hypothetical protein